LPGRLRGTMVSRVSSGVLLVAVSLTVAGPAMPQVDGRQALARELAHLMLNDTLRRELDEQVAMGLITALGSSLQTRLSRRLHESEWRLVNEIVRRFVGDTLVPSRTDDLAANVHAGHFDEAELRQLVACQCSEGGRKSGLHG